MSPQDFVQLVTRRVQIRNPPFPIHLTVMEIASTPHVPAYEVGAVVLYVGVRVNDRLSGEPLPISFEYVIGGVELSHWDDQRAIDFVRHRLHQIATHEMDEALHLDGKRVFDPHEPPKVMKIDITIGGGTP